MADPVIPTVNGLAVAAPVSGVIGVPESMPHYYDGNIPHPDFPGLFTLQVVATTADAPFPTQYQAPNYHIGQQPINTQQPQAVFGTDGICTSAGWTPGGDWYNVGDTTGKPSAAPSNVRVGVQPVKGGAEAAALREAAIAYARSLGLK